MTDKHIGSNFDDFLKEECIEFEEQEFKKGINIPSRQIIIDGVNVSELTSDQLACMNRYSVARLFIELVKALSRTEDDYDKLAEENEKLEKEKEDYCFDCDVAERMRKVTYAATGGRLSYANYTVEAIEQAYNDQLRIDVEYRTKELEEELDQLKETNESLLSIQYKLADSNTKLRQALTEIKEIAKGIAKSTYDSYPYGGDVATWEAQRAKQILEKISEVLDDR